MAENIRVEDMDVSDEEKTLIIKALTDKTFRDTLERQVNSGGAELSDAELSNVAGGVGSLNLASLRGVLLATRQIMDRINKGAEVLCGGGLA